MWEKGEAGRVRETETHTVRHARENIRAHRERETGRQREKQKDKAVVDTERDSGSHVIRIRIGCHTDFEYA